VATTHMSTSPASAATTRSTASMSRSSMCWAMRWRCRR
jgi:hypothetical protein